MNAERKSSARIAIIGAGFAGAATAWWLRHYGETDTLVLEREPAAGIQASGQNAAMARQATTDPLISRLCAEGVRFMTSAPKEFHGGRPIFQRAGSALMGSSALVQKMAGVLQKVLPADEYEIGTTERLHAIPYLAGGGSLSVLYTKSDGFIDLHSLLSGFLRETEVRTSCALVSAARSAEGWILRTSTGPIRCSKLVISAGAWSGPCGTSAGSGRMPLQPTRRHLFQSERRNVFAKEAPFVWDISSECYVRPDGDGGLFLSACDQDPYDPSTPLLPDPGMLKTVKGKLARAFPSLTKIRIQRYWPGTRTLTPDGRFIIGADPKIENLYWAAGLGGHGVTTAAAAGRIAAECILGIKAPLAELSAARFQ